MTPLIKLAHLLTAGTWVANVRSIGPAPNVLYPKPMMLSPITAGAYCAVTVEVRWLQALANRPEITEVPAFSDETNAALDAIITALDGRTPLKTIVVPGRTVNIVVK